MSTVPEKSSLIMKIFYIITVMILRTVKRIMMIMNMHMTMQIIRIISTRIQIIRRTIVIETIK